MINQINNYYNAKEYNILQPKYSTGDDVYLKKCFTINTFNIG